SRTRWRRASPASSSRPYRLPRSGARAIGRQATSRPTISTCARFSAGSSRNHGHTIQALDLLEQAIAIDRHYGPALAWAAMCHMTLVRDGWAEEPETSRRKGIDLARRALEVGENDPRILANAANAMALFGEDIDSMIGLVDRALTLNPS